MQQHHCSVSAYNSTVRVRAVIFFHACDGVTKCQRRPSTAQTCLHEAYRCRGQDGIDQNRAGIVVVGMYGVRWTIASRVFRSRARVFSPLSWLRSQGTGYVCRPSPSRAWNKELAMKSSERSSCASRRRCVGGKDLRRALVGICRRVLQLFFVLV